MVAATTRIGHPMDRAFRFTEMRRVMHGGRSWWFTGATTSEDRGGGGGVGLFRVERDTLAEVAARCVWKLRTNAGWLDLVRYWSKCGLSS
jgi:hypothetical protein